MPAGLLFPHSDISLNLTRLSPRFFPRLSANSTKGSGPKSRADLWVTCAPWQLIDEGVHVASLFPCEPDTFDAHSRSFDNCHEAAVRRQCHAVGEPNAVSHDGSPPRVRIVPQETTCGFSLLKMQNSHSMWGLSVREISRHDFNHGRLRIENSMWPHCELGSSELCFDGIIGGDDSFLNSITSCGTCPVLGNDSHFKNN